MKAREMMEVSMMGICLSVVWVSGEDEEIESVLRGGWRGKNQVKKLRLYSSAQDIVSPDLDLQYHLFPMYCQPCFMTKFGRKDAGEARFPES